MDDYDTIHNSSKIDYIFNVYSNQIAREQCLIIMDSININDVELRNYICNEIIKRITEAKNGFAILNDRYITNIGMRVLYNETIDGVHHSKQILLQVWRSRYRSTFELHNDAYDGAFDDYNNTEDDFM